MRKTPVSGFPRALLSLAVIRKRALESRLSGSVFVGCLPHGWVEVVADCVVELTGDDWVVGCLFASLEADVNSAVCIRVRTLVFCVCF